MVITERHHARIRIPMMTLSFISYIAEKNIFLLLSLIPMPLVVTVYSVTRIYVYIDTYYINICCDYFSIHTSNFLPLRTKSFLCIHETRTIILLIWRPTRTFWRPTRTFWRPTRTLSHKIGDPQDNSI